MLLLLILDSLKFCSFGNGYIQNGIELQGIQDPQCLSHILWMLPSIA